MDVAVAKHHYIHVADAVNHSYAKLTQIWCQITGVLVKQWNLENLKIADAKHARLTLVMQILSV